MNTVTSIVAVSQLPSQLASDITIPACDPDASFAELWVHGRSPCTEKAYRTNYAKLRKHIGIGNPLAAVTLADLQSFSDSLSASGLGNESIRQVLSTIKSLFGFAHKTGYLPFDVSRAIRVPKSENRLAERILSEADVKTLLSAEVPARDSVILHLLYNSGCRASELVSLRWRDCQERGKTGQVTVMGKGRKTRAILLSANVWRMLVSLQPFGVDPDESVFGIGYHRLWVIVGNAGIKAGIAKHIHPHVLRHCHATHSLERGAPIHLVANTLGHAQGLATVQKYLHCRPDESSATYLEVQ